MNGVQQYAPDKALSLICEMLEAAGLKVRKHYLGEGEDVLTELEVSNLASLERGDMSINQEGFVTWDHETAISDDKGIREIVDIMKVLLAAAPSGTGSTERPATTGASPGMLKSDSTAGGTSQGQREGLT